MIQEYTYKNEIYKIIDTINIYGIGFVISKNSQNELTYMKITNISSKTVFTPLENLIQVLEAYNTKKIYNIKKVLDIFVEKLNILIKNGKTKYDSKEIISKFNNFIKEINIKTNEDIEEKELKKINKFLKQFEKQPKILKLCNVYGIMLLISIIGIGIFATSILSWLNEGNNVKNLSSDIIADTTKEETKGLNKDEIVNILNDITDIDKYSYSYWGYSNVTMLSIDFTELLAQNPDTVGWLQVNNTKIDYPVVQSSDNSYYLDHSFEKQYSGAGWIFADYRSNFTNLEKNTVIYGHGRKDNTMFGTLDDTLSSSWYTEPENQIIKLSTPKKDMLWQIISIYTIPAESYYLTHTFESDETYNKFLNTITSRSIYDFNAKVTASDHILTLSTCLDNSGNRIVVHAKLVKTVNRD